MRLIRHGFGGTISVADGVQRDVFYLLHGDLTVSAVPSYFQEKQVDRNRTLATELLRDSSRREPWRDAAEKAEFDDDIRVALLRSPPSPLKSITIL